MSCEPDLKRRKMETHVSGDDNVQDVSLNGVLASKTLHCRSATASASGDFGDTTHQCLALVAGDTSEHEGETERHIDVYQQSCEFGDSWTQTYQLPLSKCPQRPIRTGNQYYDGIIPELEAVGFKPLQIVAKGKSGTIVLAQDLSKMQNYQDCETTPVAVKLSTGKPRRNVNRLGVKAEMYEEISTHRELHHPNIVSWLAKIDYKGRVASVMEYCPCGNMEEMLKYQPGRFLMEDVARRYFRQIHAAVEYIHLQGYAHRDICLQNVLLSQDNVVKLSDFGSAVKFMVSCDPLVEDECGSLGYQAPEVLSKTPYNPKVADIWSLGATLYAMCTGSLPLGTIRSDVIENSSKEIKFPSPRVMTFSRQFMELVRGHLAIPSVRYTLNRIAHSDWVVKSDNSVQIGHFYKVRQPHKTGEGALERDIKIKLQI
ncbi:uncharacterized protein LOC127834586 [Dreissena polymorpha]|uniref:Protein kinase domain-containing protein n=1 Tax=Dreissena polymorpha TaxID=45954 RepID=A0A9D4FZG3_DREPO|nr:uncharacterized protein LOC127834586 [Dreissena polymorpha]KAH3804782.1 hypothetical protein DPMN_133070 [Dreissena polymorpha]